MSGKPKKEIILSKRQQEIITGALLGDGHITKNYFKNYIFRNSQFCYCSSVLNHVEFIRKEIQEFLPNESKEKSKKISYFDKRTNKIYTRYIIRTKLNTLFSKLRNKWYPKGKKIIPKDIKLNPLVCLIWYIGDGGLTAGRTQILKLSTNGFKYNEVKKYLLPQLYNFSAKVYSIEKNQPIIIIPRIKIKKFLEYIGNCPFKEYKYKWNFLEYKNKKFENGETKSHGINEKEFISLYKKGFTYYAIAKKFNIEPNAVKYYIKKKGIYKGKNK